MPRDTDNLERATITEHIMAVARTTPVFERIDLIRAYFSEHRTSGWQERLDSLVAEGELYFKEDPVREDHYSIDYCGRYSINPIEGGD